MIFSYLIKFPFNGGMFSLTHTSATLFLDVISVTTTRKNIEIGTAIAEAAIPYLP